jgi:ureidoacrylate peracid hydrolase
MKSPPLQPGWVAPPRTALLVIDIQVDFAAPDGAMARQGADMTRITPAVAQAQALAAAARAAHVPLVFSRVVTAPHLETAVEWEARARRGDHGPGICVEGSPGAAFLAPLPQDGDVVITKHRYSLFAGNRLGEQLKARGIDTLVLCGVTTECCVQSTAWDAFERAFHIFLAADACAAYSPELHEGALKSLELNGAFLGAAADIAAAWEKR